MLWAQRVASSCLPPLQAPAGCSKGPSGPRTPPARLLLQPGVLWAGVSTETCIHTVSQYLRIYTARLCAGCWGIPGGEGVTACGLSYIRRKKTHVLTSSNRWRIINRAGRAGGGSEWPLRRNQSPESGGEAVIGLGGQGGFDRHSGDGSRTVSGRGPPANCGISCR